MVFENLGNMGNMLKQLGQARGMFKDIQEEMRQSIFEGESNGVKAKVSGDMQIKELSLPTNLTEDGNFQRLELCTKEAVNKALSEAKDKMASKLKGLTGGLGVPGLGI